MGHAPENTIASIEKALALGVQCIEIDVYYVDRRLIVFHDDCLERTTNGTGKLVEKKFDYLRSLDAGGGEKIPTLKEVFDAIHFQAGINIELKGPETARPVLKFISRMRKSGLRGDMILISSFHRNELKRVRQIDPYIKIGAMVSGRFPGDLEFAVSLGAFSVHISLKSINGKIVDLAHSMGFKVFVYTVNHPDDIKRMSNLGVDGIFTDYPERVIKSKNYKHAIGWV